MLLDTDTNVCYVSKLLAEQTRGMELIEEILQTGISVELLDDTRDIWARDYMPIKFLMTNSLGLNSRRTISIMMTISERLLLKLVFATARGFGFYCKAPSPK